MGELASQLALPLPALLEFLGRMVEGGHLVRVAHNRYYPPEAVAGLFAQARALAAEQADGSYDAAGYRDRTGIGRNLSVQVLRSSSTAPASAASTAAVTGGYDPAACYLPAALTATASHGRAMFPGGAPGLQNRWDAPGVSGGFDSHALPPHAVQAPQRQAAPHRLCLSVVQFGDRGMEPG